MLSFAVLAIFAASLLFFLAARSRAVQAVGGVLAELHSRPSYHGMYSGLWVLLVGLFLLIVVSLAWGRFNDVSLMNSILQAEPVMSEIEAELVLADAKSIAQGNIASRTDDLRTGLAARAGAIEQTRQWASVVIALLGAFLAGLFTFRQVDPEFRARNKSEKIITAVLMGCAIVAILTTIGIVLSLIFETIRFFNQIDWQIWKFLFGTTWSPLSGVQDGVLDADKVGAAPLFIGTFMITIIAMIVAVPIGLFAAIYLSDFASPGVRAWAKPMLEVLAGIPTVVYGFFAAITVAPQIRGFGESIGLSVASESALAAGVVMGIMIIPFISSLSDDVINAVPQALRDGSYGLGATKAETIRQVVLPAALPGIVSAVLLGVSRAVGETMIVVMAAGQGANLTANPLEAVTTVTVQIVMLITGDTEASTAAGPAFTLGFTLFCVTLALNVIALKVVRKYREQYD